MTRTPRPLWIDDRAPYSVTELILLVGSLLTSSILALIIVYQLYIFCAGLLAKVGQALLVPS